MPDLNIRAELFPIRCEALPQLMIYRLSLAQGQDFNTLSWQLAYCLRKLSGGIWVVSGGRLISDQILTDTAWPELLRRCWEDKPELASIQSVEALPDDLLMAADQACFMAKGLLSSRKSSFDRLLSRYHVRFGTVEVRRQVMLKDWVVQCQPCVSISLRSETIYAQELTETLRQFPGSKALGLKVRGKLDDISGEIGAIVGSLGEQRERLLAYKPEAAKAEAIQNGADDIPVISVKTRKRSYDYPANLLELVPHPASYARLRVDGQKVLAAQRLKPEQRWQIVSELVSPLQKAGLLGEAIAQAIRPELAAEKVKLGGDRICLANDRRLLSLLKEHGVYAASASAGKIPTRVIYLCPPGQFKAFKAQMPAFLSLLREECQRFRVGLSFEKRIPVQLLSGSRGELEQQVQAMLNESRPELVLAIFPQEDRLEDLDDQSPSVYRALKQVLLSHSIQSQCLTLEKILRRDNKGEALYLRSMTNLVLGILAKTGQVPYVLAEPMSFTDYVVGLDISRMAKQRSSGSTNVAAATRIFRSDGHLFSYHLLPPDAVEGETLSRRVIEELFPYRDFAGKRVVVHRDGPYRQQEQAHFAHWGHEIGATFHLIEVIKSGNPRIYRSSGTQFAKPAKGDLIRLSDREALLVSSLPPFETGTPRPLRIISDGSLSLEQAVESVYKLTLLHYGSQLNPRLPVTVHYSDQMAWLAHRGVRPAQAVGSIPYWI